MAVPCIKELKCCPYCGHDEYYTIQRADPKCRVYYSERFDGGEADNCGVFENMGYFNSVFAFCKNCNKTIGRNK